MGLKHVGPQDNGWPPALNRKDATAFIRAVKRYGLEIRLPQIAAEIGPVMEEAPEEARQAPLLLHGADLCGKHLLGSDCGGGLERRIGVAHTAAPRNCMVYLWHHGLGRMHLSSQGHPLSCALTGHPARFGPLQQGARPGTILGQPLSLLGIETQWRHRAHLCVTLPTASPIKGAHAAGC